MKKGRPPKYTQEMLAYLKKNVKGKQWAVITKHFNSVFNTAFTESQIENCCHYMGYKRLMPHAGFKSTYAPEIIAFMKNNIEGAGSFSKLAGLVYSIFGISCTRKQIAGIFYRQGIKLNLEKGKGAISPIGSEWADPSGYVYVKVSTTGTRAQKWKRKHHIVWEAVNGKVPKDKHIIFLDGNRQNCEIENLALVDMVEKLHLTRHGLRFTDPELTQTGIAIIKHSMAIAEYLIGKNTEEKPHIRKSPFTPEIKDFIERHWQEVNTYPGLVELVNRHFNTSLTYIQINNFTNRQGLRYGKHENAQGVSA